MGFQMNFSDIYLRLKNDKKFFMQFIFLCLITLTQVYSLWHQSNIEKSLDNLHQTNKLQEQRYQEINNNLTAIAKSISENKNLSKNKLENVDQKLGLIQNSINNHASKEDVENLQHEVVRLQSMLTSKKSDAIIENKESHQTQSSSRHLNETVSDTESSNKMTLAKKRVLSNPVYLSPRSLPFRVSSIDIWNGTPEATIYHGYSADLMEKDEVRDGWQLIHLSFDNGKVVFQNKRHQRVRVCLL
jgi:hypothetical protein